MVFKWKRPKENYNPHVDFRAWDRQENRFHYEIQLSEMKHDFFFIHYLSGRFEIHPFIGSRDKNDVKIYWKDLVAGWQNGEKWICRVELIQDDMGAFCFHPDYLIPPKYEVKWSDGYVFGNEYLPFSEPVDEDSVQFKKH